MSGVRLLVGTKKGAFVMTADGKRDRWTIEGPHFATGSGWADIGLPTGMGRLRQRVSGIAFRRAYLRQHAVRHRVYSLRL